MRLGAINSLCSLWWGLIPISSNFGPQLKIQHYFIYYLYMDGCCIQCGKIFDKKYKDQRFCSKRCKGLHQSSVQKLKNEQVYYNNPKICPQCGKTIVFEKRFNKFCSQSCANRYTDLHRVRCGWAVEQREKFSLSKRKDRQASKCIYCGDNIDKGTCCKKCLPYIRRVKTFQKFGAVNGPLKERNQMMLNILYNEYFELKQSLVQIRKRYNVDVSTLWKYIRENFGDCRDQKESVLLAIDEGRLTPNNSNKFISGSHTSWEGYKYNFRSSWEEKFMIELDENKIPYRYEPFCIKYFNSVKNEYRIAFPDFYLPETREIIELKSSYTLGDIQEMKDKFVAYEHEGYYPRLLLDWEYVNINEI